MAPHIGRPRAGLFLLAGAVLACTTASPAVRAADPGPAPALAVSTVEEPVVLGADTVMSLRGRWEGTWVLDNGSRGTLRLQIQQADASRVSGVLRMGDTAWPGLDEQNFSAAPQFVDGRAVLPLQVGNTTLSLELIRSGQGWRLNGTSRFAPTGQAIRYEVTRGAVLRRPPPDVSQLLAPQPARITPSALPANWYRRGAFMEIHVRAWRDSNGDGVGDLRGLISQLDYLADLGIRGLWLMPITYSQDHDHGYAVADYRAVEPDYGTTADVQALVKAAHARGIGIIVDYVMNHSAVLHPVFANAADSPDNALRSWYLWQDTKPEGWSIYGRFPWYKAGTSWYFGGFGGGMPDWNLTHPDVVAWHKDNLRYWLNLGVDGFRFDAVGNLVENGQDQWESQPQNYELMREVRDNVMQYPGRFVVCEAPHDPRGFSRACGSAFAFGLNKQLVRAARGNAEALAAVVAEIEHLPPTMATMVSNHDAFAGRRAADQLKGDEAGLRLLAATYLTLPGIPFVYYGEEIGQAAPQGQGADQELRSPMSWTGDERTAGFSSVAPFRPVAANVATANVAAQRGKPESLLSLYRELLRLRRDSAALAMGTFEQAQVQDTTLSFRRIEGKERVLVLFNYGTGQASVVASALPPSVRLQAVLPASAPSATVGKDGTVGVTLPARSFAIYRY